MNVVKIYGTVYSAIEVSSSERKAADPVLLDSSGMIFEERFDIVDNNGKTYYSYLTKETAEKILDEYAKHPNAIVVKESEEKMNFLELLLNDIIEFHSSESEKRNGIDENSAMWFAVNPDFRCFCQDIEIQKFLAGRNKVGILSDRLRFNREFADYSQKCFSVHDISEDK